VSINYFPILNNRLYFDTTFHEVTAMAMAQNAMVGSVEVHVGLVCSQLNEKHRRWVAGLLSEMMGYGGTKWVSEITGLDPKTIRQGRIDLDNRLTEYPTDRVRRVGGGRPPLKSKDPTLEQDLLALVEPETGGDPEGHCRCTRSSLRSLAKRLGRICATTVGRLLKPLDYSLKTNIKRLIGKPHPQRDRQYRFIQRIKSQFIRSGQPVISVDAKKSELIGNFKNPGARYCQNADNVNAYDFPSDAECRATPYGIYDQQASHALVAVGTSATTSQFAVASIRHWWRQFGKTRYPDAHHLLIEADAGGCNGHRPHLWKRELQQLSNDTDLSITVCHYPTGASKWNPIEHRVFGQITKNWAGHPLRSLAIMLGFIRGTGKYIITIICNPVIYQYHENRILYSLPNENKISLSAFLSVSKSL
jgi:hypothetical protein